MIPNQDQLQMWAFVRHYLKVVADGVSEEELNQEMSLFYDVVANEYETLIYDVIKHTLNLVLKNFNEEEYKYIREGFLKTHKDIMDREADEILRIIRIKAGHLKE